jgi:hypothetical protein
MTAKTNAGPCTAEANCPGMQMALDGCGARGLGFHWATLMDLKKGGVTLRLAYRMPKAPKGEVPIILVNHCPWCGVDVSGAEVVP